MKRRGRVPASYALVLTVFITSITALPRFARALDADENGVEDSLEQQLVDKFCPSLVLHRGDQGVCPEPVEIVTHQLFRTYRSSATGEYNDVGFVTLPANYDYSFIDGWMWGGPYTRDPLFCDPAGPSWELYHVDYAGPGNTCEYVSTRPEDKPDLWYSTYLNGRTWRSPDNTQSAYYPPGSSFPTTTYAHIFTHPNGVERVIQYWFFYPFDDWIGNHEGDWEHINVVVSSSNPLTAAVDSVIYYFHEKYKVCSVVQTENPNGPFDCYIEDGSHPVVFVGGHGETDEHGHGSGEGSHGSYPVWGVWQHVVLGSKYGFQGVDYGEELDGQGLYLPWFTIVDENGSDHDGVVLIKNPSNYNYTTHPEMSWLKADIAWGHPFVDSYGIHNALADFFNTRLGNEAPRGPAHQDTWNRVLGVNGVDVPILPYLYLARDFPYASMANWQRPDPGVIAFPAAGAIIRGSTEVRGTVYYADSLVLEVGAGLAPTEWSKEGMTVNNAPLLNSVIGTWDTGDVPSGTYTIRLSAYFNGTPSIKTVAVDVLHQSTVVNKLGGTDFQTLNDALQWAQGGDTVYLTEGQWFYENIHLADNVHLVGNGSGATIVGQGNAPTVDVSTVSPDHPCEIRGITILHDAQETDATRCLYANGGGAIVKDCTLGGAGGYEGVGALINGNAHVEFMTCSFNSLRAGQGSSAYGGAAAVTVRATRTGSSPNYVYHNPQVTFMDCIFWSNQGGPEEPGGPIGSTVSAEYYAEPTVPEIRFERCSFYENDCTSTAAVSVQNCSNAVFSECEFTDNDAGGSQPRVLYVFNSNVTLDRCTIAANNFVYDFEPITPIWVEGMGGNQLTISNTIIAYHRGYPLAGDIPAGAIVRDCIFYSNDTIGDGISDAEWVAAGQNVRNISPAFCQCGFDPDLRSDVHVQAFSPAISGGYFGSRVGALKVGCVPAATITVGSGEEGLVPGPVVVGCPAGETDHLTITVDFDDAAMTRSIAASELSLRPPYLSFGLCSSDTIRGDTEANVSNGYVMTLDHPYLSGYGEADSFVLYLNGYALEDTAVINHRSFDMKSAGSPGPAPCSGELSCPDGKVTTADYNWFASHYPTGSNPNAPYSKAADYRAPIGQITLADNNEFVMHFVGVGHKQPSLNPLLQTAGEEQFVATHVEFAFTEEYVTALDHRVYADVTLEQCANTNWCVFAIRANRSDLALVTWEPTSWAVNSVPFCQATIDGENELIFSVIMINDTAEETRHLGRLVFEAQGADPVVISEGEFILTFGEVALTGVQGGEALVAGNEPLFAQMSGVTGRVLSQTGQQVIHNRLEQNFPNPFNPQTTLAYSLKDASDVSLTIYDVAGRRVRDLVNEHRQPGAYKMVWDGRDGKGTQVASGIYFYKLVAGSFVDTKKMIMLK